MNVPKKLLFHLATLLVGSIMGILSAFSVTRTDVEIVHGFPLPWAAWQKVGDSWWDFIGPLSPILFVADVLIGIGFAYLVLTVVRLALRRFGFEN